MVIIFIAMVRKTINTKISHFMKIIDPKGIRIHLTYLDFVTTRENLFQIQ